MTVGSASVPNWLFRDTSVSLYAVMVYGALASHQGKGGIYPSRSVIAREARCSVRKVSDALNELERLGLMTRTQRTSKSGRASNGYELHPGGFLGADEVEAPDAFTGEVEAPDAWGEGTSEQIAPLIEEKPLKSIESVFEDFWKVYPRHVAKAASKAKFVTLSKKVDPELIVAGARRFALVSVGTESKFIPHPTTWLNQGRWEDEVEVASTTTAQVGVVDSRPPWAMTLKISLEEYLERADEPGWAESMRRLAETRGW